MLTPWTRDELKAYAESITRDSPRIDRFHKENILDFLEKRKPGPTTVLYAAADDCDCRGRDVIYLRTANWDIEGFAVIHCNQCGKPCRDAFTKPEPILNWSI